ncbi:MAG: RluA family pseudouridine synthase [Thermogutta sp.]
MADYRALGDEPIELTVTEHEADWRLDAFLVYHFSAYSRSLLRQVITAGGVTVDEKGAKPAYRLKIGQKVRVKLPELPRQCPRPENIPLEVLYEDDWLAVINKPPRMVVHPARGHWSGTLASAIQYLYGGKLSTLGGPNRPGIVHRLDADTSGAIVIAKHDLAHGKLAAQFAERTVEKTYLAITSGIPDRDADWIDQPIGLHPRQREKMAIRRHDPQARHAQTLYRIIERFRGFALVSAHPKTGRTHQIRVHLAHIGCPVLCDRYYGGRSILTRGEIRGEPADDAVILSRQALHAWKIAFTHPGIHQRLEVEAPLPTDLATVLEELRQYRKLT